MKLSMAMAMELVGTFREQSILIESVSLRLAVHLWLIKP